MIVLTSRDDLYQIIEDLANALESAHSDTSGTTHDAGMCSVCALITDARESIEPVEVDDDESEGN